MERLPTDFFLQGFFFAVKLEVYKINLLVLSQTHDYAHALSPDLSISNNYGRKTDN